MKDFLRAIFRSYGFVPILFALLIFASYLTDYMFKGQMSYPHPLFALALFVFGILWTRWFHKRRR